MNCQEALELLYDIIDKEASEIDQEQFRTHLKQCQDCFDVYKLEESFQAFIDEKLSAAEGTPELDRLKANIIAELDNVDIEQGKKSMEVPRRLGYSTWVFVAVASLIITIGAAFFTSDMVRHYRLYAPLERAHLDAISASNSRSTSISTANLVSSVEQQFGYALGLELDNFKLESGFFENLMGTRMAHLIYANGDHRISVFVAPAVGYEIPKEVDNVRVLSEGEEFFDHKCKGCRMVFHKSDKAVIVTATTDNSIELLSFAAGHKLL